MPRMPGRGSGSKNEGSGFRGQGGGGEAVYGYQLAIYRRNGYQAGRVVNMGIFLPSTGKRKP